MRTAKRDLAKPHTIVSLLKLEMEGCSLENAPAALSCHYLHRKWKETKRNAAVVYAGEYCHWLPVSFSTAASAALWRYASKIPQQKSTEELGLSASAWQPHKTSERGSALLCKKSALQHARFR